MSTSFISDKDFTTPAHARVAAAIEDERPSRRTAPAGGRVTGVLVFLAAIWLVVSAVPIAYLTAGRYDVFWIDSVIGITLATVTILRLVRQTDSPALIWVSAGLAGWLVVSPLVFEYGWSRATANDLVVGCFVLIMLALGTAPSK